VPPKRNALKSSPLLKKRQRASGFLCPKAVASFVVSPNMNTDYGFLHLFNALKFESAP
jgi:hypothetical protein